MATQFKTTDPFAPLYLHEIIARNGIQAPSVTLPDAPPSRTWGEYGKDVALSLGEGVLSASLPLALLGDKITTGGWIGPRTTLLSDIANSAQAAKSAKAQDWTKQQRDRANAAEAATSKVLGDIVYALEPTNIGKLKAKREGTLSAEDQAKYAATVAQAADSFVGQGARLAAGMGRSLWDSATTPSQWGEATANLLPNIMSLGAGALLAESAKTAAKTAAKNAIVKALGQEGANTVAELAKKSVTARLAAKGLANIGTGTAITMGAMQSAGSTGGDTVNALMHLPQATWDANPQYAALAQAIGPENAKQQLAFELANTAAGRQFVTSLALNAIPGASAMERTLASKGVRPQAGDALRYRQAPVAALKEGLTEAPEGGGEQLWQNLAVNTIDPKQDALEGVGQSMGQEAFGGGLAGSAVHAGHVWGHTRGPLPLQQRTKEQTAPQWTPDETPYTAAEAAWHEAHYAVPEDAQHEQQRPAAEDAWYAEPPSASDEAPYEARHVVPEEPEGAYEARHVVLDDARYEEQRPTPEAAWYAERPSDADADAHEEWQATPEAATGKTLEEARQLALPLDMSPVDQSANGLNALPNTSVAGDALRAAKPQERGPMSRGVNAALDARAAQADGEQLGLALGLEGHAQGRSAAQMSEAQALRAERMAAQGQDYFATPTVPAAYDNATPALAKVPHTTVSAHEAVAPKAERDQVTPMLGAKTPPPVASASDAALRKEHAPTIPRAPGASTVAPLQTNSAPEPATGRSLTPEPATGRHRLPQILQQYAPEPTPYFSDISDFSRGSLDGIAVKVKPIAPNRVLYYVTSHSGLASLLVDEREWRRSRYVVVDKPEVAHRESERLRYQAVISFRENSLSGAAFENPAQDATAGQTYATNLVAPYAIQTVTFKKKDVGGAAKNLLLREFDREDIDDKRVRYHRKGLPWHVEPEPDKKATPARKRAPKKDTPPQPVSAEPAQGARPFEGAASQARQPKRNVRADKTPVDQTRAQDAAPLPSPAAADDTPSKRAQSTHDKGSATTEGAAAHAHKIRNAIDAKLPGVLGALEQAGKVRVTPTLAQAQTQAQAARRAKGGVQSKQGSDFKRATDGRVQGFYDPVTQRAFLIAANLDEDSAAAVLLHEVGIHMSADNKMQGLFARALQLVQKGNDPFLREVAQRMQDVGASNAEEAAAYITELYAIKQQSAPASVITWINALKARIMAWLYGKGVPVGRVLSPADIAAVARARAVSMAHTQPAASVTQAQQADDARPSLAGAHSTVSDLKKIYGGRAAYQKAKDAGRTKLNYDHWLVVRSDAFKQWFGNWEAHKNWEALQNSAVPKLDHTPNLAHRKAVEDAFKQFKPVTNAHDGRVITFAVAAAGKMTRHQGFPIRSIAAAFDKLVAQAVPMLSQKEEIKEGHREHTTNIDAFHHYLTRFEKDGKRYYLRFTVKAMHAKRQGIGDNFTHSAFVSDVDVYKEKDVAAYPASFWVINPGLTGGATPLDGILASWLAEVNTSARPSEVDPHTQEPTEQVVQEYLAAAQLDGVKFSETPATHTIAKIVPRRYAANPTLNAAVNRLASINLPFQRKVGDYLSYLFNDGSHWSGAKTLWAQSVGTMHGLAQRNVHFKTVFEKTQLMLNHTSKYASRTAALAPTILPTIDSLVDLKNFVTGKRAALSEEQNQQLAAPVFEGTLRYTRDVHGAPVLVRDALARAQHMSTAQKAQALIQGNALSVELWQKWQQVAEGERAARVDTLYKRRFGTPGVVWNEGELRNLWKLDAKLIQGYQEFRQAVAHSMADLAKSSMVAMLKLHLPFVHDAQVDAVMDAETLPQALAALHRILHRAPDLKPELVNDIEERSADLVYKVRRLLQQGYAPLSRFGDYTLDVQDAQGKRLYFGMFDSAAQRSQMERYLRAAAPEFAKAQYLNGIVSRSEKEEFHGVSPETAALFGEFLGLDPTGDSAADKAWQGYLQKAVGQRSALKHLIHRKGVPGFNEDVSRVLAAFITSNSRQAARNTTAMDIQRSIREIPVREGLLRDHAISLQKYLQNPQEEGHRIKSLMFMHFIGGSLASAFVNLMQTPTMTLPWLSQYIGAARALAICAKAMVDAAKPGGTGDAKLEAALKAAEDLVSPQEVHQLLRLAGGAAMLRTGSGTRASAAQAKAHNLITGTSLIWSALFSLSEQFNRRAAFIAAWRVATAVKRDDPLQFARETIEQTQGIYNKGNKPRFARPYAGGVLMMFKQYSITYLEMLHRMWSQGGPQGKRAALFALAIQYVLAGSSGLPFADDLEDLVSGMLQRMGYNVDTRQLRDQWVRDVLGDTFADLNDKGITGLASSAVNISGRLGQGDLIPGTGIFTIKGDYAHDVFEMAGPAGAFAQQYGSALASAVDGEAGAALLSAAPTALKNLAKGVDMAATGAYRDSKGRTVVQVNAAEAFFKGLGFQPGTVKRVQDATREAYRAKEQYAVARSKFARDWAEAKFKGDVQAEQKARDAIAQWNANNPDYPMTNMLPTVLRNLRAMRMDKAERLIKSTPKAIRARAKAMIADRMGAQEAEEEEE